MKTITQLEKEAFAALKDQFGLTNVMQSPRLTKITVSVGVGNRYDDKKRALVADRLAKITGQKAKLSGTKKAIANFKTRINDPVGLSVTLRGARAQSFFDKLVNIVFPRVRDFRGINPKIVDSMGNATVGLRENTVFPETAEEDLKDVFGLAITIGTSSKDKALTEAFLRHMGFPFTK